MPRNDVFLAPESGLADTYSRLSTADNPHRRGKDFEKLLRRAFELAHFIVELDPGMALPRQTDLAVRYGERRYLLECKWQQAKADIDVLGTVHDRLRRVSSLVVGVIVSVSGFTTTLIDEVSRERSRPVLLMDHEDVLDVLRDPASLPGLLQNKQEWLVTHGRVHLGAGAVQGLRRPARELPASDLVLCGQGGDTLPYMSAPGGFTSAVFATSVTDVDWSFGRGHGVCLDMPVQARSTEDLVGLLHTLDEFGLTSHRPTWTLQQLDTSWFGIGAPALIEALDEAPQRTAALDEPHHSEQLVYCDTALDGLYTLTASISAPPLPGEVSSEDEQAGRRAVSRCRLSFQLPGTPLDTTALQHLRERFGVTANAYFRPLESTAVRVTWLDQQPVEPLATILELDPITSTRFVVGLVIRDHYSANGDHAVLTGWPLELQDSGFLVCALAHHHPADKPPERYWLEAIHSASTSDLTVTTIQANW
ncbi:restriction endonuclease [Streptomyces sp. WA6-1-16]|uniref:restriction endonuclease n=1 Tax=Streptomyces sp. WA6-1-16 TaxID=2879427 RepID=UPI001CE352B6|nr:restriction endonuclease [Streptomyces sp. WA6-1-16]UCA51100.1 restriction endonuclease [Streptomyces sp. WA6-1-16]UCA51113.1 restriction endonuclease [Streptomyces sp. WA6-1-16]